MGPDRPRPLDERAAEASVAVAAEAVRERSALINARKLVPLPPSAPPDKLDGVIDGSGVPMTSKETAGRAGQGEDGRARTREVKLAVFFTQDKPDKDGVRRLRRRRSHLQDGRRAKTRTGRHALDPRRS